MLTPEDIQLFIKAEKEVFPSKVDFEELRADFRNLQTSVDNYAKKADNYYKEMAVLMHRVNRMEDWVKKASVKLGIDFSI